MSRVLRQNTTANIGIGPFLSTSDGYTPMTGLTIAQSAIRLKKNGDAWSQKNDSNSATHEEFGWYEVQLNTTDTNQPGSLIVAASGSGSLPVWDYFTVLPSTVFDAMVSGTEWLHVDSFKPDWTISRTTLTVKKPDDATTDYTKSLTGTPGADPVTAAQ